MVHSALGRSGVLVAWLLLLGTPGCGRSSGASSASLGSRAAAPTVLPAPPGASLVRELTTQLASPGELDVASLDDEGLAAVMQSLHLRIAEEAQLAADSATSPEVRQSSGELYARHAGALTSYRSLFQRLSIVPRAGRASQLIDADTIGQVLTLRADSGTTFFDRDAL